VLWKLHEDCLDLQRVFRIASSNVAYNRGKLENQGLYCRTEDEEGRWQIDWQSSTLLFLTVLRITKRGFL